jgi:tetratricopeptide (TPR) repeat protein
MLKCPTFIWKITANEQLGRLDNTIRDLDAAIAKWSSGGRRLGDADAAIKRLSKDKERIEEVTQNLGILKYLCDVANAAIEGEKSIVDLRETMYWFKKLLEEVNPGWIEGDIDEVTGDTEKDHNRRMEALNTFLFNMNDRVEEIVDIMNKNIIPDELRKLFLKQGHSLKKMQLRTLQESNKWKIFGRNTLYFIQRNKKNRLSIYENKNPILEIFHSIFSATIATFHAINTININDTIKSDRKKQKQIKSNLARRWGKLGRRINEINKGVVYIPHEVVIKCYEISTNPRLYPNNNASFDGLGWELFNAGEFEKAKEAFNTVITIEEEAKKAGSEKKDKYSHDATAGIGKIYELKGDIQSAEAYYKDSAETCIRLHGESNPFETIKSLKKTAENLKDLRFFDVSEDEKIRFLEDTLEVYNEGLKLSQRIGLSPKIEEFQERIRLVKKQIELIEEKKIPHKLLLREVLEAPIDGLLSIESNSKNISALYNKGNALYKLGRNEEAIKCYDRSLEFDPENVFVLIRKGETINRLRKHKEALKCFERVLELNPKDPVRVIALHNKGFILGKMRKNEEALECFNEVLEIDPEYALAWKDKGFVLIDMKRYEEAIKWFGNAIEHFKKKLEEDPDLEPLLVLSWIGRGYAFGKFEKYKEAIKCFDEAIKLKSDYARAWNGKGFVLSKMKRYDDAVKCFDNAIKLEPDFSSAWNGKGEALGKLGEKRHENALYEEALKCFNKALELNPKYIEALDTKGVLLSKMEKDEEALKCFDKILFEINPEYVSSLINKGFSLGKLEKHEEAIECYNKAIEIELGNTDAWNNKGYVLEKSGRYEDAIKCYEKTIEIEPDNAVAWKSKGFTLEKLERNEEALKCYDTAIEIKPINANTWKTKGYLLEKLGNQEEASKCFERASEIEQTLIGRRISIKEKLTKVLQEISKKPEDYELFKQVFMEEFDLKSKKIDQKRLRSEFYSLITLSLEEASKESPFETSAKIFLSCKQFCEDVGGEELKHRFTSRFRNYRVVLRFFRQIIFGTGYYNIGPIESKEELNSILLEFDRTFGKIGMGTPALEEIKEGCIRSEKFEEYRDKIERIFGKIDIKIPLRGEIEEESGQSKRIYVKTEETGQVEIERIEDIFSRISKKPEDYELFEQLFKTEFDIRPGVKEMTNKKKKIESTLEYIVNMSLGKALRDSPFEIPAKIFQLCQKFCEYAGGEELKQKFTDKSYKRMLLYFRSIIFGTGYHNIGSVESKDELISFLEAFGEAFEKLGVKTPTLDEIEERCKRSEKYEEYRDRVEIVFG